MICVFVWTTVDCRLSTVDNIEHRMEKHRKFDLAEGYSKSRREKTMSLFLIFKINRVLEAAIHSADK